MQKYTVVNAQTGGILGRRQTWESAVGVARRHGGDCYIRERNAATRYIETGTADGIGTVLAR